jgi:hypothetical protein
MWSRPSCGVREADGPVLDLGTGGGDFYAGLAPLLTGSVATEGWPPNFDIARHEEYDASEVRRVRTDGGVFLNQQVHIGRSADRTS